MSGASNCNAGGLSFAGCDPMIFATGPNFSPNTTGIPNVPNYFCCGGNEHNLATIRVSTISTGGASGAASGTVSAQFIPLVGSEKYFICGQPVTRQGDLGTANNNNTMSTQIVPSQTKYFVLG